MGTSMEKLHAEAQKHERERRELILGWAGFLDRYSWDAFATLTFAQSRNAVGARATFQRWVRRVEQRAKREISWALAVERSAGGVVHLHALSGAGGGLEPREYREAWTFGRSEVVPYDRGRGARFYLFKDIGTSRLLDYDVSQSLAGISEAA